MSDDGMIERKATAAAREVASYALPAGEPPAWIERARRLRRKGKPWDEIAKAVGARRTTVHRWLAGEPAHSDDELCRSASCRPRKPRPKAGEINPSVMEAAALFAAGKITRQELSYRLRMGD